MDNYTILPDKMISDADLGMMSGKFLSLKIKTFVEACKFVHELPYGYNSVKDDSMILFKEKMGTCTTKHAVIATLAAELDLSVAKNIAIYGMTEEIVTGAHHILEKYGLPYLPMTHCFLVYGDFKVDLTEGNNNGKNKPIDHFLYTESVTANISSKEEYLKYRKALKSHVLNRPEFKGIDIKQILHAREQGLALLKKNVKRQP